MSNECDRVQTWIDASASPLPGKMQGALARHFEACKECQAYRQMIYAFRKLSRADAASTVIDSRVVHAAVYGNGGINTAKRYWLWGPPFAAAVAALMLVTLPPAPHAVNGPVVDHGSAKPQTSASRGGGLPALSADHIEAPLAVGEMAIGKAHVRLAAHARLSAPKQGVDLALEEGRLELTALHTDPRKYVVQTRLFRVEVLGASALIDQHAVVVRNGTVRIVSVSGTVLANSLGAGSRWVYPSKTPTPESSSTAPGELLVQARQRIAMGDAAGAEDLVRRALRGALSREARAEAETLVAECEQFKGNFEAAARQYEYVGAKYAATRSGENGVFAAAKLWQRQGQTERAQVLLRSYLRHYPNGLFRADVERRLAR